MDHEPAKRRKLSEAFDLPTKDLGEGPRTSSTTQPKDDIHPSNHDDEGWTDDDDLENGIILQKPTVEKTFGAVTPSGPVEHVRQMKAKEPQEVSSPSKKSSTQKTDKGLAIDDAALDGSSTDGSSIDDAATGEPDQRSRVRHSSTLPATPKTPLSPSNVDTPSTARSGAVVFFDDDEMDPEEASRQFPGPHDIKLNFAGWAVKACTKKGTRRQNSAYILPKDVRLDLCQHIVRNNYIHGSQGADRSTLDNFYDKYNLRDPQKLALARTFFKYEIIECAEKFTTRIRQDHGIRKLTVVTETGNAEVVQYARGYDYLLNLTKDNWDETMKRKFIDLEEAQDVVRTSVEDVLQLRNTFNKAIGLKNGADAPTLVDTPTPPSHSASDSPMRRTPSRRAEVRAFINDGTAKGVYNRQEFSNLRLHFSEQLERLRSRRG